jgi:ribosomal protein L16/L10AE
MLQPKRTKYRKQHEGKDQRFSTTKVVQLILVLSALKQPQPGRITNRQIEVCSYCDDPLYEKGR